MDEQDAQSPRERAGGMKLRQSWPFLFSPLLPFNMKISLSSANAAKDEASEISLSRGESVNIRMRISRLMRIHVTSRWRVASRRVASPRSSVKRA